MTTATKETVKSIREILQTFMGLTDDQILLAYQKFDIPPDGQLFIALSYVSGKAIGNNSEFIGDTKQEQISTTMHELIQIDAMGFGPNSQARRRKEEIIAALRSTTSEQIQARDNFSVGRIPSEFINASDLEETQYLERYTMTVAVTSLSTFVRTPDYFSEFPGKFKVSGQDSFTDFDTAGGDQP